jgi:flagellar assembly factor FliW
MKLKTTNGKSIDTDKLTDKDAEIYEALNVLYKTCDKFNVTLFARVVLNDKNHAGVQNIAKGSKKKRNEQFSYLLGLLNKFVTESTNGQVQMIKLK